MFDLGPIQASGRARPKVKFPAYIEGIRRRAVFFKKDERGSLVIFSLFLFVIIMIVGGFAVDTIRHETTRAKLQYTVDRAVLAAADLEQTLPAQQVVDDYFAKAGLSQYPVTVTVDQGFNYRRVDASLTGTVDTLFMNMLGVNSIDAPAQSAAMEGIMDVEISLVLDVSGSMNSNNRLNLLKKAAKDFVDAVIPVGAAEKNVSISIIPFATQVNAGAGLLDYYNVSNEHSYSNCVDFQSSDFDSSALSTTQALQRTGHFAPWTYTRPVNSIYYVCNPDAAREILPWSDDPVVLKAAIDALVAGGNTSIDVGTKWGTALLDPSSQSIVTDKIAKNQVHADFAGRPMNYDVKNILKVLVVMSDGQNTSQYYLKDNYKSGLSNTFLDANGGGTYDDRYSQYSAAYNDYYHMSSQKYYTYPDGGSDAVQLTYPDVFSLMSVNYWAYYLKARADGGSSSYWANQVFGYVPGSTKNARSSAICGAAKSKGILVFTIGMETYGQGDATLLDCASSSAHFFDVKGVEISEAFNAIAAKINQLKLVQ